MNYDYEISISRAPDGRPVVTSDPDVPLNQECIAGQPPDPSEALFIHLDVRYNGKLFPIWFCGTRDMLAERNLEKSIEDRSPEIIEAIKKWEERQ
jgi:hypothetical protein